MQKPASKAPKQKKEQPEKKYRIEHLLNIAKLMHAKGNEVVGPQRRHWSDST